MPSFDSIYDATVRLVSGTATEEDRTLLLEALRSGTANLLTGERAVTVGGSLTDSIIITGNGNVVVDKNAVLALENVLHGKAQSRFLSLYANSLTAVIDLLHYFPSDDVRLSRDALSLCLQNIRSVVAAYFPDLSGLEINANMMVALPITGGQSDDSPGLMFVDPGKELAAYQCQLVIKGWAHDSHCAPHEFALPVASEHVWTLPGAPRTFINGNIEIVGDIQRESEIERLTEGQPPSVAILIRQYFRARTSFRSFACWRVSYRDQPVGVLTIQSSVPDIFGADSLRANAIVGYIKPYCSVLGSVVYSRRPE